MKNEDVPSEDSPVARENSRQLVARYSDVLGVILDDTRDDLAKADQKASLVLAGLGVGLGAALAGAVSNDWSPSKPSSCPEFAWWSGAILLGIAVVLAGLAVWPRYELAKTPKQLHYWGDFAGLDGVSSLASQLKRLEPDMATRQASQLLVLSGTVLRKYRLVRWAMAASAVGVLLLLGSTR